MGFVYNFERATCFEIVLFSKRYIIFMDVYSEPVNYDAVLQHLVDEIEKRPLNSRDIEGVLRDQYGITSETHEEIERRIFYALESRFYTTFDGNLVIYFKDTSDLGKYQFRRTPPRLFDKHNVSLYANDHLKLSNILQSIKDEREI